MKYVLLDEKEGEKIFLKYLRKKKKDFKNKLVWQSKNALCEKYSNNTITSFAR